MDLAMDWMYAFSRLVGSGDGRGREIDADYGEFGWDWLLSQMGAVYRTFHFVCDVAAP